ncbi:nucleotide exchange factor GrpE [Candidatus Pacearchaeota archaeon]|nr:nucleotide exchange factor GrpE [Candidatus Pacearchaeota archaeon]
MVENKKTQEVPQTDEVSEADEKAGEELMAKILNAMKTGEVPQEETPSFEAKEKEYQDKILRLQADFDNFRKRTEKEKQEHSSIANANLITELLPALDHFELALKHNKDKGVQMIYDELNEILAKNGLKIINTKGIFNPNIHEAVMKVDGKKDNEIVEEIQKGYLINEKLLRASKVKISKITEKK